MPDHSSPIDWSACEIARRIAQRDVSAAEVTQAFIDRIQQVNPRLNAVVVPRFEQALAEAAAVDQQLARAPNTTPGPGSNGAGDQALLGVPITLKECFHLAGTPSSIGLNAAAHLQPVASDGILVQRLRQAGAIVLGKTNVPQLMIWHESDNPVYGRTSNPWNEERTCGGSSGGEAAIIAARGSPLGLGNDLGGSIRIPAHFCGICGLRPTSLRLPRSGATRTLRGFEAFVTQPGPLARHVEDLWLAFQVLANDHDGLVAGDVVPAPPRDPAAVDIDRLRILAWSDDGVFPPSPAVARAVSEAVALLRQQGAEIVELSPDEVEQQFHPQEVFDLYCSLIGADGAADARRLARGSQLDPRVARLMWIAGQSRPLRVAVVAALRAAGQNWMARIVSHARPRSADQYWQLVNRKNQLTSRVLSHLQAQNIQALVCPPHALPATLHVKAFDLLAAASYSLLINFLGLPAGCVPVTKVAANEEAGRLPSRDTVLRFARQTDTGSSGLPVGVQVASLPWREDIVLAVMRCIAGRNSVSSDSAAGYDFERGNGCGSIAKIDDSL